MKKILLNSRLIAFAVIFLMSVNTLIFAQPTVNSVTPNLSVILQSDAGSATFTLTIIYDQAMDNTVNPTVSFPTAGENPAATLTEVPGTWSTTTFTDDTYTATFDVTDADEEILDIDIQISGAQNLGGQTQTTATFTDVFSIDMLQPSVVSVTPNLSTIVDANVGAAAFSIAILFSEPLNTGVAPTIAFNTVGEDPVAAGVLSNPAGMWSNANQTYTVTYDVTDNAADMFNIDVDVNGAQDVAGNNQAANYDADNNFSIKLSNPTVTLATTNLTTIIDANAGAGTFTISLTFSETMDGVTNPVISFPNAGGQTTLTTNSNTWNATNDVFSLAYTVTDNNENIPNIDIRAINARDSYGNLMQQYDESAKFNIDMRNPAVSAVTVNANPVADANVGTGSFTLTVDYDENMNTGVNPVISFPTVGEDPTVNTLTYVGASSYWASNTRFVAVYDVTDANETIQNIDIRISGAQDAAGNTQDQYDDSDYLNVDTENPNVSSISVNIDPVTDVNAGATFTVTVVFSEDMLNTSTPNIVFPVENPGSTLSSTGGSWVNSTTYAENYTITDANQELADIDIQVTNARDVAGNTQIISTQADIFDIDMQAPAVNNITPNPITITDGDVGANNFSLTIDYNEIMNTGINPSITFPTAGEDPSSTITFSTGVWNTNTQYVAQYNVADNDDNIANIDIYITGAVDAAGNTQTTVTNSDVFSIDMSNPSVTSVTSNVATITNGNVGSGTFTLTIVYDKNMNASINPVVSFPTAGEDAEANTLTFNAGASSWSSATTYNAVYDVADAEETISDIDVRVSGAQDVSGNTQSAVDFANNFSIDTRDPAVNSLSVNINPIIETNNGGTFIITVVYGENMNNAIDPTITFPVENPLSTITFNSGSWTANNTYEASYDISDANQELADIDIQVSGARDLNNNTQISYTAVNNFSIDMLTPTLNPLSITSNNANNSSLAKAGDQITVSFTASETLSALPVATIGGQAATVTNTGGLNYTATRTLDGSETEGVCSINISYSDASSNPNTSTNTDITDASSVILDFTAPNSQDAVFGTSVTQYGGSTVSINSSGDITNKVWFAPAGQIVETDFIAGSTMTQAADGTATSITAPADEGTYYIYVIDEAGNVSSQSTATLTVNNVPQLANIETGALRYIEGDGQVAVTSSITVDDDLDNINSATIQITGNYQNGEDVLAYSGSLTQSWDAATGTLTLSGNNTRAVYETALRSVTYEDNSPTPSNLTRTISFTINDGTYDSNIETRDIVLTPVLAVPGDYTTIQLAIDNAINGDRITVGSGTFTENIDFQGKEIEIVGNGPGNSIIDGAVSGSVVTFDNGETSNCLLQGFTIRNGSGTNINLALPYSPKTNYGGGIYINGASPVLENLIIENNTVARDGENGGSGGGIYIGGGGVVRLNNVTVRNNFSERYQGGGITIENANVVFNTVTIQNNITGNYGGGISARNANLDFTDVTITGNTANGVNGMGGAMFLINCTINFDNVTSNGNTANRTGDGLCTFSTPAITTGAPNNITDQYIRLD